MGDMVRVLVVDDHPVVRQGMRALFASSPELEVVGEAADAEQALALVTATAPDVVVTDLRLGGGHDGVWIAEQLDGPAVVILTTYDHDRDIVRAVEAGVAGYLLKDADADVLIRAVVDAAAGLDVLPSEFSQRVVDSMREARPELSDREKQVLRQVATGASNRDIAKRLFITEATVKTHLARAFAKLGVNSRTAAVARAHEHGLFG